MLKSKNKKLETDEESEDDDYDPDKPDDIGEEGEAEAEEDEEEEDDDDEDEEDNRARDYKKIVGEEEEEEEYDDDPVEDIHGKIAVDDVSPLKQRKNRFIEEAEGEDIGEDLFDEEAYQNEFLELNNNREKEKEEIKKKVLEILTKDKVVEINKDLFSDLSNFDIYELKLANIASFQMKQYIEKDFKKELPIQIIDDKGRKVIKKFPHDHYIRWKHSDQLKLKENEANQIEKIRDELDIESNINIVSNSYLIEMVDGSFKLNINGHIFDTVKANSSNLCFSLNQNTDEHSVFMGKGKIKNKLILKKNFKDMFNRKMSHNSNESEVLYADVNKEEIGVKVKMAHSYFDKNKFSREEYMAKGSKVNTLKKIEKLIKKTQFTGELTGADLNTFSKIDEPSSSKLLSRKKIKNDDDE